MIGSETYLLTGIRRKCPGNKLYYYYYYYFFKYSIYVLLSWSENFMSHPYLSQGSINTECSNSHAPSSAVSTHCGGLIKTSVQCLMSDLHLHGNRMGSVPSISTALQRLNLWFVRWEKVSVSFTGFSIIVNSFGSPDDAAGQLSEGLKLRDFADDACYPDPHPSRLRTQSVGYACLSLEFRVLLHCVVLFVFLNFLVWVRAFRPDVRGFEKNKKINHPAKGQGGSIA